MTIGDRVCLISERDGVAAGSIGVVFGYSRMADKPETIAVRFDAKPLVVTAAEVELLRPE